MKVTARAALLVAALAALAPAAAGAETYDPRQDNALPVAPRTMESPLRGSLEIVAGWSPGGGASFVTGVAGGVDRLIGGHLALGGRLGYLAAGADDDGTSFAAFDGGVRLRWGFVSWRESDRQQLELEAGLGLRLGSSGASDATTWAGVNASLGLFRLGVRYGRGLLGDPADDALLAVVEWVTPAVTHADPSRVLRRKRRGPRIGLGTHLVVGGYGLGALGPQLPGLALELPIYLGHHLVLSPRWDLSWYAVADGGAVVVDTALVDLWWGFGGDDARFGLIAGAGWAAAHADPAEVRAGGPVADLGFFYLLASPGVFVGLHGRAGLTADGEDLRAVFVTVGGRQIFR